MRVHEDASLSRQILFIYFFGSLCVILETAVLAYECDTGMHLSVKSSMKLSEESRENSAQTCQHICINCEAYRWSGEHCVRASTGIPIHHSNG